ncbi:MAG TPA: isoprenylcysteine carboxylmethyltransferase family protein [Thermoanaerobaculia bacterium]|nr:isoprenylcysteine carboxylmethyltransferase family protein [Thermoanaerobaculia bacterium]
MARSADAPDILILPPVLVGGTLLAGVGIHYAFWTVTVLPTMPARMIGITLLACSVLLGQRAHRAMKRAGTNVLPTRPTLAIATDGPYRFTRNPIYIAAIGVYAGVSLLVNGLAPLLLLIPMSVLLHRGIVLPEERYLTSKFGETYRSYQSAVPRWLVFRHRAVNRS